MKVLSPIFPIFFLAGATGLLGRSAPGRVGSAPEITCVVSLLLPGSAMSVFAATEQTVHATVIVRGRNVDPDIQLDSTEPNISLEVKSHLEASEYSPSCVGQTLHFVFEFKFWGERSHEMRPSIVRFYPPNRYVIKIKPVSAIVD